MFRFLIVPNYKPINFSDINALSKVFGGKMTDAVRAWQPAVAMDFGFK